MRLTHIITLLTTSATLITALPTPQDEPTTGGTHPLTPGWTNITYFDDGEDLCAIDRFLRNDKLDKASCTEFCNRSVAIAQLENHDCQLTLFTKSEWCGPAGGGMQVV
jgi:hypothetical protein